ncbi:hypothetical protein RRSWK_04477 [Rhodopirellula sp. SWK7]|nr:hypothetical protein RRSWK_04477 [Rhodopirellula sp. SWK7]
MRATTVVRVNLHVRVMTILSKIRGLTCRCNLVAMGPFVDSERQRRADRKDPGPSKSIPFDHDSSP